MWNRVDYLLIDDARTRWRMILTAASGIALWGLLSAEGKELQVVQVDALIFGAIVLAVQVFLYVLEPVWPPLTDDNAVWRAELLAWRLRGGLPGLATVSLVIVLFISITGNRMQAAILNKRLSKIVARQEPVASKVIEITSVAADAAQLRTRLDKSLLVSAFDQAIQGGTQAGQLLESVVNARAKIGRMPGSGPGASQVWLDQGPVKMPRCSSENYTQGADAQLRARHGEWISFDDMERWPTTINKCTLSLDGQKIVDTYLWAVVVTYEGGPTHLVNARFGPSRFEIRDTNNANVRRFIQALLSAGDNVVSLDIP
jgi:hypothetical protein